MGKKEASKGREWEKGRRDVLNQTFNELYQALPSYIEGQTLSKKTILIQALACIRELQQSKKGDDKDKYVLKIADVEKWVQNILVKFNLLLSFLETINVKVPSECLSIDAPPQGIGFDVLELLPKLGKSRLVTESCSQDNNPCGGQSTEKNKISDLPNDLNLASSSSFCTRSNSKKTVYNSNVCGKVSKSENLLGDSDENLVANPSIIQSRPLVVQSSSLQMPSQILFTSNSSNTPLTSSLPLLVSVSGMKTVNPFILVQSNIMAPNTSAPPKVVRSGSSRPIQPCPTSKISKRTQKIPIPSLRQKFLVNGLCHSTPLKGMKRNLVKNPSKPSREIKSGKSSRKMKSHKGKQPSSSTDTTNSLAVGKKMSSNDLHDSNNLTDRKVDNKNVGTVSEVDKENIVHCNPTSEVNADNSKKNTVVSRDTALPTENGTTKEDETRKHIVPICIMESPLENQEAKTMSTSNGPESSNKVKKRSLESEDINCHKPQKCMNKISQEKPSLELPESQAPKMSKSNYSISALCERQQLMQTSENNPIEPGTCDTPSSKNSETEKIKLPSDPNVENNNVPVVTMVSKLNDDCSMEKEKVVLPTSNDGCNEWSEKLKMKPDRPSTSYNIFSSAPLHNSKNTFIPINDIENFKAAPEPFDPNDNSFGLPIQPTDIPNDLFASFQVPTGGQHPESISPTAAFLLAFPLVSTSKATELDEAVCENTDSQPGMKTILQIGNLDCDTPVTKCVSVFSTVENSNVVYTSPNVFSQDTLTVSAHKSRTSTADVLNFPPREAAQKNNNSNMVETSSPLKGGLPFSSKENYQPACSSSNKRICTSRTDSAALSSISNLNGQPNGTRVPLKNGNLLQASSLNKSPQKLIHSENSSTFLGCEKQDWLEMSQAPLTIFPDYPPPNSSRSDCAVNYVLPPVLMSSSAGGEEQHAKNQGSSSIPANILSWSTISSTGNNQSSTSATKLANFQEMFPSGKVTNKTGEVQQSVPNQNVSPAGSRTELVPTSMSTIGNKLNSVLTNYSEILPTSSESDSLLSGKPSAHSHNFIPSGNSTEVRKSFLALSGTKELVCSTSEVLKNAAISCGTVTQQHTRTATSHSSSAKMMYPSSENKSSKSSIVYFDERLTSQNMKMGISTGLGNPSKDPSSVLNYNENNTVAAVLEEKQLLSNYGEIPSLNDKGPLGHPNFGINYNQQNNILPKQNVGSGSHYSSGISGVTDSKKDVSSFTQNSGVSIEVQKQMTSSLHYTHENAAMLQFGSNSLNLPSGENDTFIVKPNNQTAQEVKSQAIQQRQPCVRSNSKESSTNLHRPPVNWMTAPDIRSHQHHSGPSFGNSSNMNSTQGLLYLPEHIKESENSGPVFDQTANFHCLDITHSAQPLYKGNEHHLFGNDSIENFHDNSAWSPSKNGGSSMLGNMMIPSTLPTLVGDLALERPSLGDNNISRPFLPSFNTDTQGCLKKSARKMINTSKRLDKSIDEPSVTSTTIGGQECSGSFLSVSQLVDNSNALKSRTISLPKENNLSYTGPFTDSDTASCQTSKQSSTKSVSSNYSTEALLSSTIPLQANQASNRKRRSHGTHYSNNYVGSSMPYQNTSTVSLQAQGTQNQYLPDLPRTNDYQGTFIPSDTVPPFILGNPSSRSHRNHSYSLQNISDRQSVENSSNPIKSHHSGSILDNTVVRTRASNHISTSNTTSTSAVSSSSNMMDFGYMNMNTTVLQDDINFTNHPPPPSFLPHHSYSMPTTQDSLYSTPRLSMHPTHHPPQNSNNQSPSATTLTNFHLSTIFPEINDKQVIC